MQLNRSDIFSNDQKYPPSQLLIADEAHCGKNTVMVAHYRIMGSYGKAIHDLHLLFFFFYILRFLPVPKLDISTVVGAAAS